MSTLAEALVATAIGLFVAIPAVAAFNYFQRKVRSILASGDTLSHVVLAHLKAVPVGAVAAAVPSDPNVGRRSSPPSEKD
jgi:biopolymer transport protein ExbB